MSARTVLRNVRVCEAGELAAGARACVVFAEGRVEEIIESTDAGETGAIVDGEGLWLLPGWVDVQINDIEWLAKGYTDPEEHATRVRDVCRYQLERGVTGLVLATLAAPEEEIVSYLRGMKRVLEGAGAVTSADGAFIGALVEGTFMNPEFHGAHNPGYVVPPDIELFDRFVETGAVRLVNVAPEMAANALELIAHAVERGVVVGAGHAKPHAERVREAVAAGLRYIIHLGNGPTGTSLKGFHDGGLLEESLSNDAIVVTLIVDGIHLNLRFVRDVIARKGLDRVVAVSDAGFAHGNPTGEFEVFGIRGRASSGGSYLEVVPAVDDSAGAAVANPHSSDSSKLFGSAADMRQVFEIALNMLAVETTGIYQRAHPALSLPEGLEVASRLCARNPAALVGESDRGRLDVGCRADAILARVDGEAGAYRVGVEGVWLAGKRLV